MTTYFSPTVKVPKILPTHTTQGSYIRIGGIDAYSVGDSQNGKAVLIVPDIIGFTSTSEQICDIIAGQGYRVVMPHFFFGEPYMIERERCESNLERFAWLSENAQTKYINQVIDQVVKYLLEEGIKSFGALGMSWGGKCAAIASQNPAFTAAVLIGVPWLNVEDFANTQCPVAIIMPGDLRDITPVIQCLQSTKPFARKIVHIRFPDMRFGWIGNFNDYSNQTIAELATETLQIAVTFFRENIGIRCY